MNFVKSRKDYDLLLAQPQTPDMSESQQLFLKGWLNKCADRPDYIPSRSDISPAQYAAHMANVVVFDILSEPTDFRYRLFGTHVREHSTEDFTGKNLSTLPGKGPKSQIWQMLDGARTKRVPLYKEVPYVGPSLLVKRSTVLFLPLANDHIDPDKIFLVAHFVK